MYKNVLQSIDNIQVWPVVSFVIFFLFFLCLLWWVFTTDRHYIDSMKHLPFDGPLAEDQRNHPAKLQ
jgi:cbb3-type cytochrome oxidase subunit 3